MAGHHFIRDQRTREILQIIIAVMGVIGVIVGILSFIF